jgi:hypothetical protein
VNKTSKQLRSTASIDTSVIGVGAVAEANNALTANAEIGCSRVSNSRSAASTCVSLSLAARCKICKYSLSAYEGCRISKSS